MRLDKYLADMGCGTRSEVKGYIKRKRIKVNGIICSFSDYKISDTDQVTFDDKLISYVHFEYYMLNKPAGVVSATRDNLCDTVLDLITSRKREDLFPVGRLDKDTEGLLLITNDGELAHRLLSPKKHVDKVYYARILGRVDEQDKKSFLQGVDIGEESLTLPAHLNIIKSDEISEIELTIHEGKFHQVKRMFEAVGKEVVYLKRISMGGLKLDKSLELGAYRELTESEIQYLKSI